MVYYDHIGLTSGDLGETNGCFTTTPGRVRVLRFGVSLLVERSPRPHCVHLYGRLFLELDAHRVEVGLVRQPFPLSRRLSVAALYLFCLFFVGGDLQEELAGPLEVLRADRGVVLRLRHVAMRRAYQIITRTCLAAVASTSTSKAPC